MARRSRLLPGNPAGLALRAGLLLVALGLDLLLLGPLLTTASLAPHQTRRVYFEPLDTGVVVMLDEQQAGYVTDLAVDATGDLMVPAGRTIAVPLERGTTITVRTAAADLAPYVVLGSERSGDSDRATRFADGAVLGVDGDGLAALPWDATRPWAEDQRWLRDLHARCRLPARAAVSIRVGVEDAAVQAGSCTADVALAAGSAHAPLLVVVTGTHAAVVSKSPGAWRQRSDVEWPLVGLAVLRVALLGAAVGAAPTALVAATLLAAGQLSRPEAVLCWAAILPLAAAGAAGRLIARVAPRRPSVAWAGAALVLALLLGGSVVAMARLGVGTFGKERITRAGDDGCAVVGYSTVRGDSLRQGTAGVVEHLGDACVRCRGRTSRFSREAQTLRWIRSVVCAPSFPAPAGGEIIFIGGGNDDLFYRPTGLAQRLGDIVTVVRVALQPVAAKDWETIFSGATRRVIPSLDEQAADIGAIAHCASAGGRRFRFVHDFLVWDLDGGRTPARQQTLERRRAAVRDAGGEFVDLLAEFGQRAGIAWFNDFIHPSAFGQRMIADLLCGRGAVNPGRSAPAAPEAPRNRVLPNRVDETPAAASD